MRSVHSLRQRMIWLEPEPGFYIHAVSSSVPFAGPSHPRSAAPTSPFHLAASLTPLTSLQTIDLPRTSRHPRTASNATDSSAPPPSTLPLDDSALLASLALAYASYRLMSGSFHGAVVQGGRQELVKRLEGYWNGWLPSWKLESGEPGAFERTVAGKHDEGRRNKAL